MSTPDIDAFLKAIDDGDIAGVEAGLAKGIKINEIYDFKPTEKAPPLVRAVARGQKEIVKLLLKSGANVDSRSDKNTTPLMYAASNNRPDCIKLLLDAGADSNLQDKHGNTALWYAVFSSGTEIVKMLISHGANLNLAGPSNSTPLIFAVRTKNIEVAKILIENGADLNAQTTPGKVTPLMHAIENEDKRMIRLLIRKGANPDMKDAQGIHAFDHALNKQIREFLAAEDAYVQSMKAGGGGGPPPTSASSSSSSSSSSSGVDNTYRGLFNRSRSEGQTPLGKGGFGSVRKVIVNGVVYAVKRVNFSKARAENRNLLKPSKRDAFEKEVSMLQKVKESKYAVQYVGAERYLDEGFICTELLTDGSDLRKAIDSNKITESNIEQIVEELLIALTSIHNLDVLHNDIKPLNIWLFDDYTVKIMDFGIACYTAGEPTCAEGSGTKIYRKILNAGGKRDKTTDFHAMAVTIADLAVSAGIMKKYVAQNLYSPDVEFKAELVGSKTSQFTWLLLTIERLGKLENSKNAIEALVPSSSSASSSSSSSSSSSASSSAPATKKERTRRQVKRAPRKSRRRRRN